MQATDNYLYVLFTDSTLDPLTRWAIKKIDRSNLTVVDTFTFDYEVSQENFGDYGFRAKSFYVMSDDLIYIARTSILWDESISLEIGYYDTVEQSYIFIDRLEQGGVHAVINQFMNFWFLPRGMDPSAPGVFYAGTIGSTGSAFGQGQGVDISIIGPIICPPAENLSGGVLMSFGDFETPDAPLFAFLVSPNGDDLVSPATDFLVQDLVP